MSAFEVNLTPTRMKTSKVRSEAREPVSVVLGPFTPKAILQYDGVPVTKTARRYLQIKNPEDCELKLNVTKLPKAELNFILEWTAKTVEANDEVFMEVSWNPIDVVSGKEILQLTDNYGRKKDISIIFKALPLKAISSTMSAAASKRNLSNKVSTVPKKLKRKSPSPPKHLLRKSILMKKSIGTINAAIFEQRFDQCQASFDENDRRLTKKIGFKPEMSFKSPLQANNLNASEIFHTKDMNFSNISIFDDTSRPSMYAGNKENRSPANASKIFDNLAFTPVSEASRKSSVKENAKGVDDLDYLSSLPTPTAAKRSDFSFAVPELRRKLHVSPEPRHSVATPPMQDNTLLSHMTTPQLSEDNVQETVETLQTPKTDVPNLSFRPVLFSTVTKLKSQLGQVLSEDNNGKKLMFDSPDDTFEVSRTVPEIFLTPCTTTTLVSTTTTLVEEEEEFFYEMEDKIMFDPHQMIDQEPNKTTTVTPPLGSLLSVIEEEESSDHMCTTYSAVTNKIGPILQKTFNIADKSVSEENMKKTFIKSPVALSAVKKPISESMQDLRPANNKSKMLRFNQGSMPNLSENVSNELKPIESNRYFFQDEMDSPNTSVISTVSTISTLSRMHDFQENEIRAQSSRVNLTDAGRLTATATTIYEFFGRSQTSSKENSPNEKAMRRQTEVCGRGGLLAMGSKRTREVDMGSPTINRKNKITKTSTMTISPPSRNKIMLDMAENGKDTTMMGGGRQIRSTNWNFKQPKKLKLSFKTEKPILNLVLKKELNTTTPTTRPRDERIILYDAELHMRGLINPDPFAATTTCDPFLASTMYLDEQTIDEHEMQFKKWLNALVTIPPELDSDPDQKIDLGKLFNEVRNKELKLAPTKELVCSKYYRTRLDCLRKSAIKLFTGEEMRQPLSKVALQVEKKLIVVRDERSLHLDLVLQREILQLLLCFNPLWLRIGLEIIYGEQLELQSNADVVGLSTFIINRMFKDRYLEAKYSKAYIYSSSYAEQIKKFMLKKFLFLLLFLDQAKEKRIIKQNPCLFVKTSPYKETKDILNRFSSQMLANVGDIGKHLRRLGYVLSHKQTYLDEYNYAFKNLAVDLRDGVRLTKLMEVILLREDLAALLRVPAISRLQKVHNVDLALKALAEADFILTGDITARDIADGHREKTLSLLWQIIYKFRAPKFNAAATTIQLWWRHINLRVEIQRRIRKKLFMRQNNAATQLQAYFKGIVTRKYYRLFRAERLQACVCLQRNLRMWAARRRFRTVHKSTIVIQRWYRSVHLMRIQRDSFVLQRQAATKIQSWYRRQLLSRKLLAAAPLIRDMQQQAVLEFQSAVVLQRCLKSYTIRRKLQETVMGIVRFSRKKREKCYNATKIQSFVRMVKERRQFLVIRKSTIVIQTHWRHYVRAKREYREYHELKRTTIVVQRYFRAQVLMKRQRTEYIHTREVIINIQQRFRASKQATLEHAAYSHLKAVTTCLQRKLRATYAMKRERHEFLKLKSVTMRIQELFRARQAVRRQQASYQALKTATLCFQRRYRALVAMREQRLYFQQLKESTIVIQTRFRGKLRMQVERAAYLRMKQVVVTIQQRFRANREMQAQRFEFVKTLHASITIQQNYRAWIAMRAQLQSYQQLRNNVICMQRRRRATSLAQKTQTDYMLLKSAALVVQARYRARLLMKEETVKYNALRRSTIWVQQQWRANKLCMQQRYEFLQIKAATLTIQRNWRATKAMQTQRIEFVTLQYHTTIVQRIFRATQAMKRDRQEYLVKKASALCFQRQFRAQVAAKTARADYLLKKKAAICLQRRFRAKLSMRSENGEFKRLREATVNMQRRVRATQLMKRERANYLYKKTLTVGLQRQIRGFLAMRKRQAKYQRMKVATRCLQARWKATLAMRKQQREFKALKETTVMLQRRFRANLQMRMQKTEYLNLKTAAVVLQRRFRAKVAMQTQRHNYLQLKQATLFVQQKLRANKLAQLEQKDFIVKRQSAVCIQKYFRAFVVMKQEREYYHQLRTATLTLQSHFRAHLLRNSKRQEFLELKKSTVVLQTKYRSILAMRNCRDQFLELKESTIVIQRQFRALLVMRRNRTEYLMLQIATITLQTQWRARKKMEVQRAIFLRQRHSAIVIQRQYRALVTKRVVQRLYVEYRRTVVFVQQRFRAQRAMREQHQRFLEQREAVLKIQQRFRAQRQMRDERAQYLAKQAAAKKIQRWVRACRAMREDRTRYLQLKSTVVAIQQKYKEKLLARSQRHQYLTLKKSVLCLQTRVRGIQARARYQAKLTPEMILLRQKNKAAKRIQAMWRGYIHRKKRQTKPMRAISTKIRETKKNVEPTATVRHQLKVSLKFLRGRFNMSEAISVLKRLENFSRTVPHLLIEHATFVANFCYGLMAQAIRSEADKQLIELCACIILNLARYSGTKREAFQANGLLTIAQMLLRWCDKECGIFNTLCTLVWIFSHSEMENQTIREYMTTNDAIYMLRETKKLVLRKEKMKKNVKRPYGCIAAPSAAMLKQLPSIEPDYGVIKQKPYAFYASVFAFDTVLQALNINIT